jgi:hypothetical protein
MKNYTPDELKEVLRQHALWLEGFPGMKRANLQGADLQSADLRGANLRSANLQCADLHDANLQGADLRGADLQGADLRGANLQGADLHGAYIHGAGETLKIAALAVYTDLYDYQCWAIVLEDGSPWVRMGCLWKSVEQWDAIGIRNSNPGEFPDDGSEASDRRVRAFEFTRAEALRMAERVRITITK